MHPIGLLVWIIIGALAGWLAGIVMRSGGGALINIVVGIVGAFIGGIVFNAFGLSGATGFNLWSIFVAFIGAVVLLTVIHLFNGRGHRRSFN